MFDKPVIRRALRILRHDLTLLALVAALVVVSTGVIAAAIRERVPAAERSTAAAAAPAQPPEELLASAEVPHDLVWLAAGEAADGQLRVTRGRLEVGDSLAGAFARAQLDGGLANQVSRELGSLFDFRRAQPGHSFRVVQSSDGELLEFRYRVSALESYLLRRNGEILTALREEAEVRSEPTRIAGLVTSSLHESIVALGERGQLANDFSDIFAWDIDFTRSVQPGDEFSILYERLYRSDEDLGEVYVGPGRILAARYRGAAGDLQAVYFETEKGHGGYYRPDGSSVEGQFLRAPLRYSRISSRFTQARRHPILNVTRPHQGIDYAAPAGTPLWSVANGRVIYRGWAGGYGNLVKVRHNNGYVSYYAHLSRFAKGLRVGQSVQQKQVIGYVGQTGLATGPHVCFRIAKDGRYFDPARLSTPGGPPVPEDLKPSFQATRDVLLAQLGAGPLVAVDQAL